MRRYVVLGALIGIGLGIIFVFTNTWVLEEEVYFNIVMNERLGFPRDYYSPGGGSIFAVGSLAPLLFGLVGGGLGFLFFSIKSRLAKKRREAQKAPLS